MIDTTKQPSAFFIEIDKTDIIEALGEFFPLLPNNIDRVVLVSRTMESDIEASHELKDSLTALSAHVLGGAADSIEIESSFNPLFVPSTANELNDSLSEVQLPNGNIYHQITGVSFSNSEDEISENDTYTFVAMRAKNEDFELTGTVEFEPFPLVDPQELMIHFSTNELLYEVH